MVQNQEKYMGMKRINFLIIFLIIFIFIWGKIIKEDKYSIIGHTIKCNNKANTCVFENFKITIDKDTQIIINDTVKNEFPVEYKKFIYFFNDSNIKYNDSLHIYTNNDTFTDTLFVDTLNNISEYKLYINESEYKIHIDSIIYQ